jgi:hypothetical protein
LVHLFVYEGLKWDHGPEVGLTGFSGGFCVDARAVIPWSL